ncbi:hypothetical protein [Streptomyces sp. NBC_00648]|uniref:hypothetical protein n=1 Tax=Streptomyces sp. NBC_00648 TaxID=2975797 RepID=UPI003255ADD2
MILRGRIRAWGRGSVRASVTPLMLSLVAVSALSGCSGSGNKKADESPPLLPERVCWGAFSGSSVAPLMSKGKGKSVEVKGDRTFDLYGRWKHSGCQIEINGVREFTAWGDRSWSEGGDLVKFMWNSMDPLNPTPISAGDKGIIYRGGASAYFRCERPGRPPSPRNVSSADVKIVELGISANTEPRTQHTKDVLAALMRQFVQFAKSELKCDP